MGGNGNMNKNGGGNAPANGPATGTGNGASANGPSGAAVNAPAVNADVGKNEYMSWSQSLKPLLEKENGFENYVIASDTNQPNITISHLRDKLKKENKQIKDLGGGDQAKITSGDDSTIGKYNKSSIIPLLTGGTDAARNKNISDFKTKLDEVKELYALKIDAETALTAAAYYDYVDKYILNGDNYSNVFAIPIGSTDLHVINYAKKDEGQGLNVEQHNLANYKTEAVTPNISDFVEKNIKEGKPLIVFAASAFHTLRKMIEENGGNPIKEEYETLVSDLKEMVSNKLIELKKMNKDQLKESGYKIDKIEDLQISINKLFPESLSAININIKVSNSKGKGESFSDEAFNECLKGLPEISSGANAAKNRTLYQKIKNRYNETFPGPTLAQITQDARPGSEFRQKMSRKISNARGKISNQFSGLKNRLTKRMFGEKKNSEEAGATGGRKRRTRKVNKNRRKTMKAKKMRRKNKNKSSKGKKSKASRRR